MVTRPWPATAVFPTTTYLLLTPNSSIPQRALLLRCNSSPTLMLQSLLKRETDSLPSVLLSICCCCACVTGLVGAVDRMCCGSFSLDYYHSEASGVDEMCQAARDGLSVVHQPALVSGVGLPLTARAGPSAPGRRSFPRSRRGYCQPLECQALHGLQQASEKERDEERDRAA